MWNTSHVCSFLKLMCLFDRPLTSGFKWWCWCCFWQGCGCGWFCCQLFIDVFYYRRRRPRRCCLLMLSFVGAVVDFRCCGLVSKPKGQTQVRQNLQNKCLWFGGCFYPFLGPQAAAGHHAQHSSCTGSCKLLDSMRGVIVGVKYESSRPHFASIHR